MVSETKIARNVQQYGGEDVWHGSLKNDRQSGQKKKAGHWQKVRKIKEQRNYDKNNEV